MPIRFDPTKQKPRTSLVLDQETREDLAVIAKFYRLNTITAAVAFAAKRTADAIRDEQRRRGERE